MLAQSLARSQDIWCWSRGLWCLWDFDTSLSQVAVVLLDISLCQTQMKRSSYLFDEVINLALSRRGGGIGGIVSIELLATVSEKVVICLKDMTVITMDWSARLAGLEKLV